jgi:hypothetical protein
MQPQSAPGEALPSFDEAKVAERCARQVEQYWAGLGHPDVWCRVERVSDGRNRQAVYEIRSNLIRGLPPLG